MEGTNAGVGGGPCAVGRGCARPALPGIGRNWRTARKGFVVLLAIAMVASVAAFYTMQALRAKQTDPDKLDNNIYWERVTAFLSLCFTAAFAFFGLMAWYMDFMRYNSNNPPHPIPADVSAATVNNA